LGIPKPDYNIGVGSGTHAYQIGEMLKGIEAILLIEKPDVVIVYGDTNSTIAGALSAVKLHIKVAHVEAGLRSFDRSMPEEINRILTDHCSEYLFCPTQTAFNNLKREGIKSGVYLTGDVMVDALASNREIAERSNILRDLGLDSKQYFLVTLHRESNTEIAQNFENIASALVELGRQGMLIVFPVHPRTKKLLKTRGLYDRLSETIRLIEPLSYFDFLKLLYHANKVLTDSGGIQKEAYILKIPCITLRENTEWIETIEDGWNVLVGNDKVKIIEMATAFQPSHQTHSLKFGNGNAALEICNIISSQGGP
jgi:UDP-N-acetylglucosamine 2-epimerase (non-hydrolysing)